jgi:hypothetical protein
MHRRSTLRASSSAQTDLGSSAKIGKRGCGWGVRLVMTEPGRPRNPNSLLNPLGWGHQAVCGWCQATRSGLQKSSWDVGGLLFYLSRLSLWADRKWWRNGCKVCKTSGAVHLRQNQTQPDGQQLSSSEGSTHHYLTRLPCYPEALFSLNNRQHNIIHAVRK